MRSSVEQVVIKKEQAGMRTNIRMRSLAAVLISTLILVMMPAFLPLDMFRSYADSEVLVKDGDTYDISKAGKNTIVAIDDRSIKSGNTAKVTLKGSSEYVWVHISASKGNNIIVDMEDGLNITPGYYSASGIGASDDTLGHSRSGIYIDETKNAGGVVLLRSKKNATINIDSYCAWFYRALPAIMKNDTKTKLVFDTEDKNEPGTIIANPTSGKVTGAAGIGAFGHGSLAHTYNSYTVGNIEFKAGNIKAYGLNDGPAIGAYEMSNIGRIDFTGANVLAKADAVDAKFVSAAAGIGTNYGGDIDEINILSGRVEAWGRGAVPAMKYNVDNGGPGIGVGMYGHFKEINILGGTVIAHGGTDCQDSGSYSGCGIGTCVTRANFGRSTGDKINISGGNITAVGGDYTCGIGGCVGEINIAPESAGTELKIDASIDQKTGSAGRKHYLGSGIGIANNIGNGNFSNYPGNITIKGGDITTSGGPLGLHGLYEDGDHFHGAGIGPTYNGRASSINISGGKIHANGGWNGPGIGGNNEQLGNNGAVESIRISGGTITSTKACENTKGDGASLSGIGGYKADNSRTDIRITGGSIIANGSDYAIGYDADGQPKNDAGEIVYGTRFKFDTDIGEGTKIDSFSIDPKLSQEYGLNDVVSAKGLDSESNDNVVEFWVPKSGDQKGYEWKLYTEDKRYGSFDTSTDPSPAAKIEAGTAISTLTAFTDITYASNVAGYKYKGSGTGVLGNTKLTIAPTPADTQFYSVKGYGDGKAMVANIGTEDGKTGDLVQNTGYVDTNAKWNVKNDELTLYLMLDQTHYKVVYDKNKPNNASHNVSGDMSDKVLPTASSSQPGTLDNNQYSLDGWTFTGWNAKEDGSGTSYTDGGNITFDPDWGEQLTLYAQWQPKTYTITFKSGDGADAQTHEQEAEYDTPAKLDTFSGFGWTVPDGKTLHGWTMSAFGSFFEDGEDFCNLCTLNGGDPEDRTLMADWAGTGSIAVTVTVDSVPKDVTNNMYIQSVGGSSTEKVVLVDKGNGRYEASLAGLPDGRYQLLMDSDEYRIPQDKQDLGSLTESSTVSRVLDYYTVTMGAADHAKDAYVSIPGFIDPTTSMKVADDTQVDISASAEQGYHFDGYSWLGTVPGNSDDSDQFDPSKKDQTVTIRGKVDLTAHAWHNVYHVSYDENKPAAASHDVEGTMPEKQDFVYDEQQDLAENGYTLTGWTFKGWSTDPNGGTDLFTDEQSMDADQWNEAGPPGEGNVTLYAQWEPNKYKVYFSASDATSGTMEPQELTYDTPATLKQNAFTRTDWHFTGWNTEPAGTGKSFEDGQEVVDLTTGSSITLYAQWEHDYYIVKFDKNDDAAKGEMPDEKVWTNCGYELPLCNFIKNGYTFVEWNTAADGSGDAYDNGEAVENLVAKGETVTLYAIWKPNKYTVKFDANEGKGTMADQQFTYDEAQDLRANTFTRAHYVFTGWNTIPDGTGKAYGNGENVKNLTIAPNDVVTLYAQWKLETHTISLDLNGGTLDGKTGTVKRTASYGDKIILPKPTREGYKFSYWKGSRYKAGASYTVKGDHSFTAQWKKDKSGGVKTGDDSDLLTWITFMTLSLLGLIVMVIARLRYGRDDQHRI